MKRNEWEVTLLPLLRVYKITRDWISRVTDLIAQEQFSLAFKRKIVGLISITPFLLERSVHVLTGLQCESKVYMKI